MRPGEYVVLDEVDTLGDPWIGIILYVDEDSVHAVRCYRGGPDERFFAVDRVTSTYPGSARDMARTALDIAACARPKAKALDRAMLAARINALAEARREIEIAESRERGSALANDFNAAMARRRNRLDSPDAAVYNGDRE